MSRSVAAFRAQSAQYVRVTQTGYSRDPWIVGELRIRQSFGRDEHEVDLVRQESLLEHFDGDCG